MPLLIGYSPSFASAKKHSGASSSGGGGNNTGQTGSNNGGSTGGGNTGSTNQQQCPNGEHFDNKKNKCVITKTKTTKTGTTSNNSTTNSSTIADKPPVAKIDGSGGPLASTAVDGQKFSVTASSSYDPDGIITKYEWTATSNWGSGAGYGPGSSAGPFGFGINVPTGATCEATNTCQETIELTVTDDKGLTGKATHILHVNTATLPTGVLQNNPEIILGKNNPGLICPQGTHPVGNGQCATGTTSTSTQQGNCPSGSHMINGDPNNCAGNYFPYDDGTCPPGRIHIPGPNQYYCSIPPVLPGSTTTPAQPICPADNHYSLKQAACISNGQPLDDGTCATNYHPHGSVCYYNNVPNPGGACEPGWHLVTSASGSRICEKNEPTKTTTTPVNCAEGSHYDATYRDCVDNRYPINGGGTCVTGYHLQTDKLCHKDTLTTHTQLPKQNNTGTGGGGSGTTTALPNADGTCPSGYHKVAKDPSHFLCAIDASTPSTTKTTGTTPVTCVGETHYDTIQGQCLINSIPLPDGSCVPGYHSGLVPGGETSTCIKNPPCPEAGTQYDPQSGKCLFNRVPDNIPTTPSKQNNTGTGGGGGGTTTGNCEPGSHQVAKTGQCVSNSIPLPDGTCATGWQLTSEFACGQTHIEAHSTTQGGTTTGTTTGGNKSSTTTPSPQTQSNKTSTNTNTVINQNTVRSQAGVGGITSSPSTNTGPAYTQTPSMSMWSLSLGKSNFPKEGLRLLANLKPFGTIGVPYTLDISFNLPSTNVSLIAAQITNAGPQHAVIIPINKTAEGTAGESLFQAELGQVITGINPFTRQPDTISGGGATDLLLFNNGNSDIVFNDDSGATMTLRYR